MNFSDLRIQLIEVFQFEVLQRSKLLSTVFYLSVGTKIQKLRAKTKNTPKTCFWSGCYRGRNKACFGADKVVPASKSSVNLAWVCRDAESSTKRSEVKVTKNIHYICFLQLLIFNTNINLSSCLGFKQIPLWRF